mmetsp:Transcript_24126/g.50158  ORF Transcript_24126/g.50158 Transcript_24126/m.50158 type:complete len:270 (-) Transcript_24126:206-1015(-)|eukprot:CAMPEP_0172445044 /NCGR_PEP_ID=MMETSP1065-20121228/5020_1 /TAXON_ID=265537 /ORGANISM="Amphiprora paludosa, Strain CCMP125" /LENGTH=269 /DNA_ID=CAMNT_0013195837 /DNA_START=114 /DNA_END=923 /DNA_ORIENTATION=-
MKFVLALTALLATGVHSFSAQAPQSMLSTAASSDDGSWDLNQISQTVARIEGQTRKTWKFSDINQEVVQVAIKSDGRPAHVETNLWIGPDWTPMKLKAYSEDGLKRPIQLLLATRNKQATIEVLNTGQYEMPLQTAANYASGALADVRNSMPNNPEVQSQYVEGGGAVKSFLFDPEVEQVQVMLHTSTRQLHAYVELLNAPNNIKQKVKTFTNNGLLNALFIVFDTPGAGNVVRVQNLAPLEFPCTAYVLPTAKGGAGDAGSDPIITGM